MDWIDEIEERTGGGFHEREGRMEYVIFMLAILILLVVLGLFF